MASAVFSSRLPIYSLFLSDLPAWPSTPNIISLSCRVRTAARHVTSFRSGLPSNRQYHHAFVFLTVTKICCEPAFTTRDPIAIKAEPSLRRSSAAQKLLIWSSRGIRYGCRPNVPPFLRKQTFINAGGDAVCPGNQWGLSNPP